ncbi:MAG: hypothetical protein RR619_12065, partial [Raoultibacter sp.]
KLNGALYVNYEDEEESASCKPQRKFTCEYRAIQTNRLLGCGHCGDSIIAVAQAIANANGEVKLNHTGKR